MIKIPNNWLLLGLTNCHSKELRELSEYRNSSSNGNMKGNGIFKSITNFIQTYNPPPTVTHTPPQSYTYNKS